MHGLKRLLRTLADSETTTGNRAAACIAAESPPPAENGSLDGAQSGGEFESFDAIYRNAQLRPARGAYSILKIVEMVHSSHLAGMSQESKRSSLLMALEAAGIHVEDLLQDAIARQRALNDYEARQQQKLKEFEIARAEENKLIQVEMDRTRAASMARIQVNLDEVSRQEETLRRWSRSKQEESGQIAEAASFFASPGSAPGGLTATVGRFSGEAVTGRR